ncbi:MAG: DUF499 domain-containing protein [Caldilineaceae bacterium]|nr:DUF499 domain-containing protein [Caldilineaceae bacterium]
MRSLNQLCTPRQSAFDTQRRDTVLDLTDLINDTIDPSQFFTENYITDGMRVLLEQGFRRLEGKSDQGVFLLKQAMGGGKTHNLLSLGLLAKHPEFRQKVMSSFFAPDPKLGSVKVVAFTGRESDAPLGVWGSIAEQLGKRDHFKEHYSPLRAPGQGAWRNLFAGEAVLILLDELPPYLEAARATDIGDSTLAQVTATALSNLLVAINTGSYEGGSGQLTSVLADLDKETNRTAMSLEPVRMGTDELYHILRTRLFEKLPAEQEIDEVAQGYAKAVRDAKQMDITSESPEQFAGRVRDAYPFHPAIRDLYARFRANPGFQQTRGLIRLMRIVTARLWQSGAADQRYLIAAHDIDLNDRETLAEITQINNTLQNAIAHDIASNGTAVAETMDSNLGNSDTSDAAKLLLMASLANVPNAVVGLSIPEMVAYLCAPGRDLSRLRGDVLEKLATAAWYLHSNRDGKLYFRNVQNLNAKLEDLVKGLVVEQAVKELRTRLEELFKPINAWCYQRVLVLPAIDKIELEQDRVMLVITEPQAGAGLRKELRGFWDQATFRNRVAFLTGAKDTYIALIDSGKRLRAIQQILEELKREKSPDNDPQMVQAKELEERIRLQFHSAVRETFTQLWYPIRQGSSQDDQGQMVSADFQMKFEGNKYNGEDQVLQILREKRKFEDDISSETFKAKVEMRLFGNIQQLPWREIKLRAAMSPAWQWHRTDALDTLKANLVNQDVWREDAGGYVDRGPFPQPDTDVLIQEQTRDADTGEVTLRVTPVHGDTIYYEVGGDATTASIKLEGNTLKTQELCVSFLVVDSKHEHKTGPAKEWKNRITLKYRMYDSGDDRMMELRAAPEATIFYITDGSNPRVAGARYNGDFAIPRGAPMVLAYAARDGVESQPEQINISWKKGKREVVIDSQRPAVWQRSHGYNSTKESFEFLARLEKYKASVHGLRLTISGDSGDSGWVELVTAEGKEITPEQVKASLEVLRDMQNGQIQLAATSLYFDEGLELQAWVEDAKLTLQQGEVKQ